MSMSQLTVSHVFLLGEFAVLSYSGPSSMSSAEAILAQNDLRKCLSSSLARTVVELTLLYPVRGNKS
jgi:hypothetical protein